MDSSPYEGKSVVASLTSATGDVTLVEGQTFSLSARSGDMLDDLPQGLFVLDTRVLSMWELRVNGFRLEPLAVTVTDPFTATFVSRGRPAMGQADADVVVFRHRHIGRGMRERLVVSNHGLDTCTLRIELTCDVDFADLFEVKESRVRHRGLSGNETTARGLVFRHLLNGHRKQVDIGFTTDAVTRNGTIEWNVVLPSGATWEECVQVTVTLGDNVIEPRFRCGVDDHEAVPRQRLASWRAKLPVVQTDNTELAAVIRRSEEDLGALRIFDPERPELAILAAGAPWFMTVFGRDSLLTAWATLIADPSLAQGVLEILARFQGSEVNPTTEEQPGKILHEMRFGDATGMSLGGGHVYYGSIDSTPLFVMLWGELQRWYPDHALAHQLLPHVDRALAWIEEYGDSDGDGYVEYERLSPAGLVNQGWKDSWDSIRFADGRLAEAPIALCEVQGYVYAAYVSRAHYAEQSGDAATVAKYRAKAADLRRRFNEDFWLEDRGWFAIGLDADKQPIDSLASNMGHCLWTGIVDPDKAEQVAKHLMSPEMFSGWGVRTLATSMAAYNPVSYHNGSIWPHDNAICAAGLSRYGFSEAAHRIIEGQLAVATAGSGRLPELFAGFDRAELPVPASYPTSCSPQAWAA
ncbi:MAG: Amylo-alpha,6-glucosidase, partial [Acidimicrobiia bacterium]|nr:Amylo-alpha,6-glucosidase [Acidimicrobiia bacterium]